MRSGTAEMTSIKVSELADNLAFGAKVTGVTLESLADETVRQQLRDLFDDRGVLAFKEMEASTELHLALAEVFGPLDHHALSGDKTKKPEVVNLKQAQDVIDIDGRQLAAYLPWHFDACYTEKLNRAAILRPVELPPEGGMTGFADGMQLYKAISPELRARFEDAKIFYHSRLMFMHQRFGFPANHRWISISPSAAELIDTCQSAMRSLHPAIWTRASGERVLHVSPWQAAGIVGHEDPEGDALLEELCQEIYAKMVPYWHRWEMTDMVLWDNWRFLHAVSGNDPAYTRHLQRATIGGDYGLGAFEEGAVGSLPPSMG
jgi:taurine dioxygenase